MNDLASSFVSIGLTYLVRSAAAYAIFWLVCRVTRDPRLRFQLCAVFMGMMVTGWIVLLMQPGPPAIGVTPGSASPPVSGFSWPWTLHLALFPRFAVVLSRVWLIYVTILSVLLLQFCMRFWRLRILLQAPEAPPECLSDLFESICSDLGVSRCELRLVRDLRSPAATSWWNPKVLLPSDLIPRLEAHQLADVLRHELIHVRRRDYLWDNLSTLSCYLLFFNPAAWLVRRRLRWERELICDRAVVKGSTTRRLEYAACLTAVAGWQLPEAESANSVDLLSSTTLFAARIHALASPAGADYSPRKKALLGLSAITALAAVASTAPDMTITCARPELHSAALPVPATRPAAVRKQKESLLKAEPRATQKRHRTPALEIIAPDHYSRLAPVRSVPSAPSAPSANKPPILPAAHEEQNPEASVRPPMPWGFAQRVGIWTIHGMKSGVSKLGAIRHKRRNKSAGESTATHA